VPIPATPGSSPLSLETLACCDFMDMICSWRGIPAPENLPAKPDVLGPGSKTIVARSSSIAERGRSQYEHHGAVVYGAFSRFRDTVADLETLGRGRDPSTCVQFGPTTSFLEAGRELAELFTPNRRQSIALRLIRHHLDRVRRDKREIAQLC